MNHGPSPSCLLSIGILFSWHLQHSHLAPNIRRIVFKDLIVRICHKKGVWGRGDLGYGSNMVSIH